MSKIIPKKITKKRITKFPNKRHNYKRYNDATWSINDILNEVDQYKKNNNVHGIKIVSEKYNISRRTLLRKYKLNVEAPEK